MLKKSKTKHQDKSVTLATRKGRRVLTIGALEEESRSLMDLGKYKEVIEIANQILAAYPQSTAALNMMANCYWTQVSLGRAQSAITRSLEIDDTDDQTLYLQAMILMSNNKPKDAHGYLKQAISLYPKKAYLYVAMAELYIKLGREDRASQLYDEAIKVDKLNPESYIFKSYLVGYTFNKTELKNIKKILSSGLASDSRVARLQFAVANHYERERDIPAQMHALNKANAIIDAQVGTNSTWEKELNGELIKDAFDKNYIKRLSEKLEDELVSGEDLIFIVGFPRSGSTLVEQILGSHSSVSSGGETDALRIAIGQFNQNNAVEKIKLPFSSAEYSVESIHEIRQFFYRQIEQYKKENIVDDGRMTDKSLINVYYVGLLKALFPKAKIIHTYKNGADTCLGCYKQILSGSTWPFIYNMEKLRAAYENYYQLVKYWDSLFPGEIFHLSYKALVADQEAITRQLLNYCDLEWDPSCINFHENTNLVSTASSFQIRKKIYHNAVDRWKKYSEFIEPLLPLAKLDPFTD